MTHYDVDTVMRQTRTMHAFTWTVGFSHFKRLILCLLTVSQFKIWFSNYRSLYKIYTKVHTTYWPSMDHWKTHRGPNPWIVASYLTTIIADCIAFQWVPKRILYSMSSTYSPINRHRFIPVNLLCQVTSERRSIKEIVRANKKKYSINQKEISGLSIR